MEADYAELATYPAERQYFPGYNDVVLGPYGQLRAGAWCIRSLMLSLLIEPDASASKLLSQQLADNFSATIQLASNPAKGETTGWIDAAYDAGPGVWAIWQNDYLALVVEWAVHAGISSAPATLNAMSPFLVNRFIQTSLYFRPLTVVRTIW